MVAIHFELDETTATQRMQARWRSDDTDESITKRIKQYYDITVPMLEVRQKTYPVIRINADQSIEQIHTEVKKSVV
jgi:adenylate kinase family enzyme